MVCFIHFIYLCSIGFILFDLFYLCGPSASILRTQGTFWGQRRAGEAGEAEDGEVILGPDGVVDLQHLGLRHTDVPLPRRHHLHAGGRRGPSAGEGVRERPMAGERRMGGKGVLCTPPPFEAGPAEDAVRGDTRGIDGNEERAGGGVEQLPPPLNPRLVGRTAGSIMF